MTKIKILPVLAVVLSAAALSACSSFAPVYGDRVGSRAMNSVAFNFSPPDTRLEQIIINRLKVAFPASASPADPVLDITVRTSTPAGPMSNAFAVARPVNVRVEASVTISQGEEALFQATRFADTAYQGDKLAPVDAQARVGAEEAAARSAAEALRTSILAGYSR